ncbi:hypothetical protein BU16DRAFT_612009 [Lophium mytilinum]|uniref:DUF7580 domain-containing protein n=1 Tax=Lophium mytilinum TaxID=390894 RepID=A0A6A6RD63_9PEZI|nr:hypothetical protein BU16DRAFT_612009 [Lophium mytilinum]
MSGAEVGLLLAIIPILVNAAEHSKRVCRPVRAALHPSDAAEKLADFFQDLHIEVNFLDITINNLIRDLPMLSEDQARRLGDFSKPSSWESPEITTALEDRLGASYKAFAATVQAALRILEDILSGQTLESLKKHGAVANPSDKYSKLSILRRNITHGDNKSSLLRRVQFSTREDKRKRSLKRLTKNNHNLERLLSQTQEPPSTKLSRKAAPKGQFWKFLHNLYDAMVRQLSCGCPPYHQGRVDMVKSLQSSLCESSATVDLDVFLSRKLMDDYETTRWHGSTISINLENLSTPKVCVSFAQDVDEDGASRTRADSVIEPRSPDLPEEAIENICHLMEVAYENECKLRMLFDSNQLFRAKSLSQHRGLGQGTSLGKLLREKRKLTLKQKRVLAVVLAHAMLQYHGSPWMSDEWSKDQVEFFCDQSGCDTLNIQRPYISTHFLESSGQAVTPDYALHQYPAVLALGIMLLEIHLGDTIESRRKPDEDCGKDGRVNVNTNLFTAHRILKDSCDDMYGNYSNAIRACLDQSIFLGMDEDDFRQALYSNIVAPLEEELKTGFQMNVSHVWEGGNLSSVQVIAGQMAACVL